MSTLQQGNVELMQIANTSLYTDTYVMSVTTVLDGTDSSTGRVSVEVTSNGVDYTQDGVVFEYQPIVQGKNLKSQYIRPYFKTSTSDW